jgi:hypothetical protein
MGFTATEVTAIVFVVFLAAVVAGLLLWLLRRLRHRRDKLVTDLKSTPELAQDRAFNRIAMARREADIVGRTGLDVNSARALIAQAQGQFDTRNFDRAYETAQLAHEALVVARRSGTMPATYLSTPKAATVTPGTRRPTAAAASPTPADTTFPKIPQNRAESQFQLRLLDQELAAAGRRPTDPPVVEATELRDQGRAAFDRGDFTEAFRLALKGRRTIGGDVGALAPTAATRASGTAAIGGDALPDDPDAAAEKLAIGDRCPDCGTPAQPNDQFCRGCGRPRAPLTCPACSAPRTPEDTFCGRCGARFS